ncbi:hypothetical protein BDY17DRAFT_100395 [Neohortaea acidophila]|uniref:Uncharacterized protein n=1 Tax=Neohortaea acidophila TaxID=245834 RepID=A0A6A6Q1I1_9PEZI|nr:uncharacterized protein BDY17DRAFT_100395 [Neohortaea acidophila]KAF2485297.1 hypothetical protein BDY17DRAFT_100395 [Neohortaea acidophila]
MASKTAHLALLLSLLALPQALLLLLALCLALAYRYIKTSPPAYQASLIKFHALATESIQLTLALVGWANFLTVAVLLLSSTHDHHDNHRSMGVLYLIGGSLILFIAGVSAVLGVYAVDLIEARVVLGVWRHPYAWRCFALTRVLLRAVWRGRRGQHATAGFKVKADPVEGRDWEDTLRSLEYLDLALGREERERGRERSRSLEYLDLDHERKEREMGARARMSR